MTLVYKLKPEDFSPTVEVAATYLYWNGQLLLLQLNPEKLEGGFWTVPAGKIENNESIIQGAKRELFEETGLNIKEEEFVDLGRLYMKKPHVDYIYHAFLINLKAAPKIILSKEHVAFKWIKLEEIDPKTLVRGGSEALEFFKNHLTL
jgi:phosphatase NudJ